MKYDVFGIGNALVDMEFTVSDQFLAQNKVEKGLMTLIDEERQNQLVSLLHLEHKDELKRQCGGSAANTVIAVSQFGGDSFYSCKVAADDGGKFYLEDLKSNGVATKLTAQTAPQGTTGKCLVMVTEDAERTMNTYLGITSTFSVDEIEWDALKNSKWLYIEGYLVASPTGQEAAVAAAKFAREHGVKIAVTMSDPGMVQYFRENFDAIIGDGVDLIFCNEIEAKEYAGTESLSDARQRMKAFAKHFVITLGKNGAVIWDGKTFVDIEPYPTEAVDSNGAGDMFAGAFMYGITNGMNMAGAGKLASLASSKIVAQFGPRLSWTQAKELLNELTGDE